MSRTGHHTVAAPRRPAAAGGVRGGLRAASPYPNSVDEIAALHLLVTVDEIAAFRLLSRRALGQRARL